MKIKQTFEDFLADKHAKDYCGTDDMMPDDLIDWMERLEVDDVIQYANEALDEQTEKIIKDIERMPSTFPEMESDDYDNGWCDAIDEISGVIKEL